MVADMYYTWKREDYAAYLRAQNKSKNTVDSLLWTLSDFFRRYEVMTEGNAYEYKDWLQDNRSPKTVNIRVNAINSYLRFSGEKDFKLKNVKIQQKPFLENVISAEDYEFLKKRLEEDNRAKDLFLVWTLGATGARVSELVKLKAEHIRAGYFDIYGKGKKYRRIYVPRTYQAFAEKHIADSNLTGYVFMNKLGERCSEANIRQRLVKLSEDYRIDRAVMHPHSFRHMFAKRFIEKHNDIAFLADLMGHEELETTRIYLRKTATEQRAIVDQVIDW
jgi:site-specific recombinase XerD